MQKVKNKEKKEDIIEEENFIDLLKENDTDKIHNYILKNGKMKPYCPIIFHNTSNNNEELPI